MATAASKSKLIELDCSRNGANRIKRFRIGANERELVRVFEYERNELEPFGVTTLNMLVDSNVRDLNISRTGKIELGDRLELN